MAEPVNSSTLINALIYVSSGLSSVAVSLATWLTWLARKNSRRIDELSSRVVFRDELDDKMKDMRNDIKDDIKDVKNIVRETHKRIDGWIMSNHGRGRD